MTKSAFVTGVTGQDGAYLARLLLDKGYRVYGAHRRVSAPNFWRLEEVSALGHENLTLVDHDLTDLSSSIRLLDSIKPDEVYNLAAQSFVQTSFEQPITTADITGRGALHMLEAIRIVNKDIRFYQASTSEMFGLVQAVPQGEETPFYPRSPYGVSKLFAHWTTVNYRESYNIFATSGILFNHESPLRGREFVTRKITDAVAGIKLGQVEVLELGNLDARRDWGYAAEYVVGMWQMMQLDDPDTFVLATGRTETVRSFVELSFQAADIELTWQGSGEDEVGIDAGTGRPLVRINPQYYRPAEVDLLVGDPSKAQKVMGWATKTSLEELSSMMVAQDIVRRQRV